MNVENVEKNGLTELSYRVKLSLAYSMIDHIEADRNETNWGIGNMGFDVRGGSFKDSCKKGDFIRFMNEVLAYEYSSLPKYNDKVGAIRRCLEEEGE